MERTLVLSSNSEPLAEASRLHPAGATSARAVLRSTRPRGLLDYYFASKERKVIMRDGNGIEARARIVGTRWDPRGRLWFVETLAD